MLVAGMLVAGSAGCGALGLAAHGRSPWPVALGVLTGCGAGWGRNELSNLAAVLALAAAPGRAAAPPESAAA